MTVTTLPAAEAQLPRRLSLQSWLSTQRHIDPDDPVNADHRTWIELVGAYDFAEAVEAFTVELEGSIDQAIRDGILQPGGFLASDEATRRKAIRAALSAGCAEILAGEVDLT